MSGDGESTKKRVKQRLTGQEMLGLRLELQILARSRAYNRTVAVLDGLE